jgi:asparagine synthase (glutamine-hydrolysing)
MCGIAGKLNLDPAQPVDEAIIRRMNAAQVHRGPDGEGVWIAGAIGLGHRRLAIVDLSPAGRQPMCNEDGSIWLVCNGEIYNHLDLRAALERRGHHYRSASDNETILHLYEEHGQSCVQHLRGMFAFALWDGRRRSLLLARDRFGQKPLLYAETPDGLAFASEIKALLQDPAVSGEVDETALHHYLTYGYIPAPQTAFRAIRKLPAASTLLWQDGHVAVERYWTLRYTPKLEIGEEEAVERLLALLREATRLQLMSDVPLGAFLSGGIDSSAVVAMMAEVTSEPVKTFSIGFDEQSFNELCYARQVAERYATEHHEFTVTPNAIAMLPELVWAYGEPYADSSALPTCYVARETRQFVTVALNGDGGDEAFAGYERYRAARLAAQYRQLPHWLRWHLIAPLARRPARWALGKLANFLARTPIPDINSGLRAMSRPVVERFFGLLPDGFSFTMTITLAMLADEYAVHFVPIAYRPRVGRSKIRPVHDTLNFLQIIIRTTLLFAPLRVFTPISLSLAILTGLKVIADIVRYDWHIATSTVVAAVVTLQMFLLGYLADLIVSTRAK